MHLSVSGRFSGRWLLPKALSRWAIFISIVARIQPAFGSGLIRAFRFKLFKYDRKPGLVLGEATFPFNGPRVPSGEAAWVESETSPGRRPPGGAADDRSAGGR